MLNGCGTAGGMQICRRNRNASVSPFALQISHDLNGDGTGIAAVEGRPPWCSLASSAGLHTAGRISTKFRSMVQALLEDTTGSLLHCFENSLRTGNHSEVEGPAFQFCQKGEHLLSNGLAALSCSAPVRYDPAGVPPGPKRHRRCPGMESVSALQHWGRVSVLS
jgi:hypothetical protein